jgi:pyruvate formate lyase activating enzyme
MTGIVFSIERYSIEDGPGIRTVLFLKGCPLHCLWCSNPESQSYAPEILYYANKCVSCGRCVQHCPQGAIRPNAKYGLVTNPDLCTVCGECVELCYYNARELSGNEMSIDQVMEVILRDKMFYEKSNGGVTISGGEPLLQAHFVHELIRACNAENIHTAIETTLYTDENIIAQTLEDVDLVFVDVKHMDTEKHFKFTGVYNDRILRNILFLDEMEKNFIIRVPFIPGFNDDLTTQKKIYKWASTLKHLKWIEILPYHRLGMGKYQALGREYPMGLTSPLKKQELLYLQEVGSEMGVDVRIGAQ